jgi:drug/metabolite transporter (DMT)-like permease
MPQECVQIASRHSWAAPESLALRPTQPDDFPIRPSPTNHLAGLTPPQAPSQASLSHSSEQQAPQAATFAGSINKLSTAFGSTIFYSLTGVFNQAARGNTTDPAQYPDPFLYCVLRSAVAGVVTYIKDRSFFKEKGLLRSFDNIGSSGRVMCGLMAAHNLLWIPAFMLTDLASALVIGGLQPFIHSIYESWRTQKLPSALKLTGLGFTATALSTIALNQSTSSVQYPHAVWGNLAAVGASLCFVTYMAINNRVVESARNRAVSSEHLCETAVTLSREEKAQQLQSKITAAQAAAQAKLRAVPFFSQVASVVAGLALFVSQTSSGVFSGDFGISPINTAIMGTLHGFCTAGGLYLRTLATQTNKPSVVSLIAGVQVGLAPVFGYLLFGNTIPEFAMIAGTLALCSSLTGVAEVHYTQKPQLRTAPTSSPTNSKK